MLNLVFLYYVFVCILPEKAVPEMTYSVYCVGRDVKPCSLTHLLNDCVKCCTGNDPSVPRDRCGCQESIVVAREEPVD